MKTKMYKNLLQWSLLALIIISCEQKYPDGIYAEIETNKGTLTAKLFYDLTPVTVANFVSLAEGSNTYVIDSLKGVPFYNGTIFHRVIKDFMIQGGDVTGTGMGNPGYKFKDEIIDTLKHIKKGLLSMANAGYGTNGSQFFITQAPTAWLDGKHTIFGEIVKGIEVVDSIATTPTSQEPATRDKPLEDIVIKKVEIIKYGQNAKNFEASAVFKTYMEEEEQAEKNKAQKIKIESEKILVEFANQKQKAKNYSSGIKILILSKGQGVKPNFDDNVMINYAGYLEESGLLFDTSWEDIAERFGQLDMQRKAQNGYAPFKTQFNDSARLIPGFREAMLTLKEGDKIRVFIPSNLAYGENGAGNVIPPNASLVFDLELKSILK